MPDGQFDWGGYLNMGSMIGNYHTQIQLYAGKSEYFCLLEESKNGKMQIISREVSRKSGSLNDYTLNL